MAHGQQCGDCWGEEGVEKAEEGMGGGNKW